MNSSEDLYRFLYNTLVEISNAKIKTIHYLIGPKWLVCEYNDTVRIADYSIKYIKKFENNIKNFKCYDINYINKIKVMFDCIIEIAKAIEDKWDNGLFDREYYYYADDTAIKAKNCIKCINEML